MAEQHTTPPSPEPEEKSEMTREELEQKLEEAKRAGFEEAYTRIRNTYAHHLGGGLQPAMTYSEIYKNDPKIPEEVREALGEIGTSTQKVVDLTNKLSQVHPDNLVIITNQGPSYYYDINASWERQQQANAEKKANPSERIEPSSFPQPSEPDPSV